MSPVETYVYGVLLGDTAKVASTPGVGPYKAPLRTVTHGSLCAVVSDVPSGDLAATREDLFRHTEILQSLMHGTTLLPMRFGTIMPDDDTVVSRLLDARSDELEQLLEELDGKVELTLRAVYHESVFAEVVADSPEIGRLNERIQAQTPEAGYYDRIRLGELVASSLQAKRESDAGTIIDRLQSHAVDVMIGEPQHERAVLNAAFLVDESRIEQFDAAAEAIAREHAERMRFRYTGPVPPFSFVALEGGVPWD
jgi:gas vesicle protein GvpL/GvpF